MTVFIYVIFLNLNLIFFICIYFLAKKLVAMYFFLVSSQAHPIRVRRQVKTLLWQLSVLTLQPKPYARRLPSFPRAFYTKQLSAWNPLSCVITP